MVPWGESIQHSQHLSLQTFPVSTSCTCTSIQSPLGPTAPVHLCFHSLIPLSLILHVLLHSAKLASAGCQPKSTSISGKICGPLHACARCARWAFSTYHCWC